MTVEMEEDDEHRGVAGEVADDEEECAKRRAEDGEED